MNTVQKVANKKDQDNDPVATQAINISYFKNAVGLHFQIEALFKQQRYGLMSDKEFADYVHEWVENYREIYNQLEEKHGS